MVSCVQQHSSSSTDQPDICHLPSTQSSSCWNGMNWTEANFLFLRHNESLHKQLTFRNATREEGLTTKQHYKCHLLIPMITRTTNLLKNLRALPSFSDRGKNKSHSQLTSTFELSSNSKRLGVILSHYILLCFPFPLDFSTKIQIIRESGVYIL